jgi:hypothetical protein
MAKIPLHIDPAIKMLHSARFCAMRKPRRSVEVSDEGQLSGFGSAAFNGSFVRRIGLMYQTHQHL